MIDDFIRQNVDNDKESFEKSKADGSMDLESRLEQYITEKRAEKVSFLAYTQIFMFFTHPNLHIPIPLLIGCIIAI